MATNQVQKNDISRRVFLGSLTCTLLGISLLSGCGPAPVKIQGDPSDAVGVLNDVLDAWKAGKKIGDLADEDPPINVQEEDWSGGAVLKAYEVNKTPKEVGGDWKVEATITIEGPGKPTGPQTVSYSVSISDKLTNISRLDIVE